MILVMGVLVVAVAAAIGVVRWALRDNPTDE